MNGTATLIAFAYGAVTLVSVLLAILVAASTRGRRRDLNEERAAEHEKAWLLVVVAILAALLFATILFVPYGHSGGRGATIVEATAQQFAWQLRPATIPAHEKIEFKLTSKDVNHGFGIYDDRGHFVAQVQVVPGKTQTLVHTFDRPGRYEILCLEFCGFGHHAMLGSFEVTR